MSSKVFLLVVTTLYVCVASFPTVGGGDKAQSLKFPQRGSVPGLVREGFPEVITLVTLLLQV